MPSYVIVGASRGLGYAWLQNLSAEPTNTVIGLARTPGPVKAQLAADKIENVHVVQADMVDNQSLVEAAKEVARLTNGSVDYLIVNGAYLNPTTQALSPVALTSDEALLRQEMQQHLDVNVIGVMLAINAFLPLVRKSSIKKIVALSSGMGVSDFVEKAGISFSVAYGSLKAALNMIIFKYSLELKDEGIVVLALSPGMVNTMVEPPTEEQMEGFKVMMQKFQALYPNFKGPITAPESVTLQKKVIEGATMKESGECLSHWGNKEWL